MRSGLGREGEWFVSFAWKVVLCCAVCLDAGRALCLRDEAMDDCTEETWKSFAETQRLLLDYYVQRPAMCRMTTSL